MTARTRVAVLAALSLAGLVLGLWVLDWWSLDRGGATLRADLRQIEACDGDRCVGGPTGGMFSTAVLVGGTALAVVTAALAALSLLGAVVAPRLVRLQVGFAVLVLGAAGILIGATPDGLGGAPIAAGAWATLGGVALAVVTGFVLLGGGGDPLGDGRSFRPIKVSVPPAVVDENARLAGATVPPPWAGQEPRPAPGTQPPTWQPMIKDIVHTEAPPPRRRSTRLPFTAPPNFDAGRQALRFVVAEATIGATGLAVTLEDHRSIDLAWSAFTRASARQLPPGPPFDRLVVVDLVTRGGAPLRFLPSTRVNYSALPGGAAPNSRENLRRLVALVVNRQPTFGVEHDSAEFFAGGREPPALPSIKHFIAYDEQFVGAIAAEPD